MKKLKVLIALSGIGLSLSIIVHVLSLFNIASPFGELTWILHGGIFVVWLPMILVLQRLKKDSNEKEFWKTAMQYCPVWIKRIVGFLVLYAFVNFIIFIATVKEDHKSDHARETPPVVLRGFSGHWMIFYWISFAALYSAHERRKDNSIRRCPDGHPISPADEYCTLCGKKIIEVKNGFQVLKKEKDRDFYRKE